MGNSYLFTGYPGFLTSRLVEALLTRREDVDRCYLLVLPSFRNQAEEQLLEIRERVGQTFDQLEIVEGDITLPDLGIQASTNRRILQEVTHVYHLAAIYDLATPFQPAYEVNVIGTKQVTDWVSQAPNLEQYTYVSTAYVSGRRSGPIYEGELSHNRGFHNFYEETKYEAEIYVQRNQSRIPTTIVRPGIVVGHSETGETAKFDGPYFILNLLGRMRHFRTIPYIGEGEGEGNFVPYDYVIDTLLYVSHDRRAIGKTLHVTDPCPYKVKEVYRMLSEGLLQRTPTSHLSFQLCEKGLNFKMAQKWLHVPKESLPYFKHDGHYDTSELSSLLANTSIRCPDFKDIVPTMIRYYEKHQKDERKQVTLT
ncbi:hypothetical protein N781_07085 [Pontibacillus halophilus JSM 076056 = DSM 19796]|uniref:Thioester reductase (TE) domain-containing protein n=1 Tax=Pontibacillus halophilus JSM 076056 = DSM 19796 TaxID=1385510 RepID=A0A0A5GBK7_9BACI|nr:SDR family oxidoreductase [Pontibacillus halophilus]KGX90551.1 hypothetical protein N781_07085 [Pontibacillus halophilus JSM 076056 = DSM 19796]